jgi:hypothetical protein
MVDGIVLNFTFQNWSTDCQSTKESCIRAIAVHEFGHALGFAHEQNRPDTPSWCNDVEGQNGDTLVGSWDLDSVMNYCNPNWNGNGHLSMRDIAGLQKFYGLGPLATRMALDGSRVAIQTSDGAAWVKEGSLYAGWVKVWNAGSCTDGTTGSGCNAAELALAGNRIGVRTSDGAAAIKEGSLYAGWVKVWNAGFCTDGMIGSGCNAAELALVGNRIGVRTSDGNAWAKEGTLDASWLCP